MNDVYFHIDNHVIKSQLTLKICLLADTQELGEGSLFLHFSSHWPNCHTLLGWAEKKIQLIKYKFYVWWTSKMMKRMTKRLTYIVTIQSCSFCAYVMLNGFVDELVLCLKCREKLLCITTGFLKKIASNLSYLSLS